jgi:hypothetical protein
MIISAIISILSLRFIGILPNALIGIISAILMIDPNALISEISALYYLPLKIFTLQFFVLDR